MGRPRGGPSAAAARAAEPVETWIGMGGSIRFAPPPRAPSREPKPGLLKEFPGLVQNETFPRGTLAGRGPAVPNWRENGLKGGFLGIRPNP